MNERPAPYAEYLKANDILSIVHGDEPVARCGELDLWRKIDRAVDGNVVSVKLVNAASMGVDLAAVPERETVERHIDKAGLTLPVRAAV